MLRGIAYRPLSETARIGFRAIGDGEVKVSPIRKSEQSTRSSFPSSISLRYCRVVLDQFSRRTAGSSPWTHRSETLFVLCPRRL
jgi:hypothetical protein